MFIDQCCPTSGDMPFWLKYESVAVAYFQSPSVRSLLRSWRLDLWARLAQISSDVPSSTMSSLSAVRALFGLPSQVLGCLKLLDVDFSDSRVNPNGGAIAVGHPLGASGARIALTAMRQLERSGGRFAAISLCIGIGQGLAAILERVD